MGRITALEQDRERLAALGTMAAGLAHELNNPAAAARRSASDLTDALDVWPTIHAFGDAGVERPDALQLVELQEQAVAAPRPTNSSALDAADAEDELPAVLEDAGVGRRGGWRRRWPRAGVDAAGWSGSGPWRARRRTRRCAGSPRR